MNDMEISKKELVKLDEAPAQITIQAMEAAKELQKIVDSREKKLVIGGKQYLFFEDWQTLGRFNRTTAKVVDTKEIYQGEKLIGFFARAVCVKDGMEISAADAECCFDEPNWGDKPRFQLRSMAQTRACAKALRNCLAFVAVLANYEPTPAEEIIPEKIIEPQNLQIPATEKQLKYISSYILTSQYLDPDEKMRLSNKMEKLTKKEASDVISWWIGDEGEGIEGERSKREKKEKVSKTKEGKAIDKSKTDILEEITRLRRENFLTNDEYFYEELDLGKKLEEYNEEELKIILERLKNYIPDLTVSDEDIPQE